MNLAQSFLYIQSMNISGVSDCCSHLTFALSAGHMVNDARGCCLIKMLFASH